jgi:hypothetical protein
MPKPLALPPLYVVEVFDVVDGRARAVRRQARPTPQAAQALAEGLALAHAGVVVWAQTADSETGEYGRPEVLLRVGTTE